MDELADMYNFAETEIIGQSYEGRDLKIIKICKGGCGNKPAIWLDGGMYDKIFAYYMKPEKEVITMKEFKLSLFMY